MASLENTSNKKIKISHYIGKMKEAGRGLLIVKNKGKVVQHLLGLAKGEKIYYHLPGNLRLEIPNKSKKDKTAILSIKEIFGDKLYSLDFPSARTIIDLGANIGVYSLYAGLQHPNAVVYAFEPDPWSFKQLKRNIEINHLQKRVKAFCMASSGKNGYIDFYVDPLTTRGSSALYPKGEKIKVKSLTLKDLFSLLKVKECDILKVDIEGAEYDLLYNSPEKIMRSVHYILLEYHKGMEQLHARYSPEAIKEFLKKRGFNILREKNDVIVAENASFKTAVHEKGL
ncbi:MAG: FkbM family methyltransferase [Nanoarchaeota archaeon]|nr:FkbM family methyltransferase [Nanoarchaeota archaeon]